MQQVKYLKAEKEKEHKKFNEVRYKYLRPRTLSKKNLLIQENYKLLATNQFPKKLGQKVNTQAIWVILQILKVKRGKCVNIINREKPLL